MDTPILGFHLQKRMLRGYLKSKNLKKIPKWRLLPAGSYPIALRFAEFINTEKIVCTLENVIKSEAFLFKSRGYPLDHRLPTCVPRTRGVISRVPRILATSLACRIRRWVLGAFIKLRRATVSFVMSVCPPAWNNWARNGRTFMKFDIEDFSKICRQNSSFIKI